MVGIRKSPHAQIGFKRPSYAEISRGVSGTRILNERRRTVMKRRLLEKTLGPRALHTIKELHLDISNLDYEMAKNIAMRQQTPLEDIDHAIEAIQGAANHIRGLTEDRGDRGHAAHHFNNLAAGTYGSLELIRDDLRKLEKKT
jgi:hypothetical protein